MLVGIQSESRRMRAQTLRVTSSNLRSAVSKDGMSYHGEASGQFYEAYGNRQDLPLPT
jgi:hypothetical protein